MSHDAQILFGIHQRLLQCDRIAPALLFQLLLDPLNREMRGHFPHTDPHLVCDGITDALLDLCTRPGQFDPARRVPLDRFLSQASWRNIRDLLRAGKRRKAREDKSAKDFTDTLVALTSSAANTEETEAALRHQQSLDLMNILPDPIDRKILELKLAGVRATGEFAKAMGIEHLPAEQQRQEVKRAKNRIDVRLKRKVRGRP